MKPVSQMSMEELAAYVCSKLGEEGIETVLSGGSCVQIYSQGKYTSDDIDLIDRFNGGHTLIKKVMFEMGFKEHNRYFVHDETEWFIEFPRGPAKNAPNRPPFAFAFGHPCRLTSGHLSRR